MLSKFGVISANAKMDDGRDDGDADADADNDRQRVEAWYTCSLKK